MNRNELFPGMETPPEGVPFPVGDDVPEAELPHGMPFGSPDDSYMADAPGSAPFGDDSVEADDFDIDTLYQKKGNGVRPVKILTGVIGDGNGGMSTYAVNLFKALPQSLVNVTFLSTSEHPFFEKEIKEHFGRIKVIPSRKQHPLEHKKAIRKILAEEHYDVCHIHLSTASNITPIQCAVKSGVPVVISHIHSAGAEGGKLAGILHKLYAPKLAKMPITRLACSEEAGKFGYAGGSFTVAPNAIDLTRFYWDEGRRDRFRSYYGIPDGAFVLGHIGRFVPVKNQGMLLDVLKALLKKREDAVLLLCGAGPEREAVRKKAEEMGLSEKVFFPGNIVNPQDAYCAMDAFILSSLFEGFPLTALEAYASGLPVFLSDKVTKEAEIGACVSFFSLDEKPETLAEKILASEIPVSERESRGKELSELGMDWGTQGERMLALYRGDSLK